MAERLTYIAIRGGKLVQVTVEPGSEGERRNWRERGEHLHQLMDDAIREAGLTVPEHPEDGDHNIAVGRALEIVAAGRVSEGAAFYNAWSAANGYPGVSILRHQPPQLDIGTAIGGMVAELRDGEVTILSAGPEWVRPGYMRAPT